MITKKSVALSPTARSAIVSTYVNALTSAENTGSLLTQVCEITTRYTKGAEMSDEDMKAIAVSIGKERGWKGLTAQARESEVRVILRASSELPEAIAGYTAKARKCDWHTGMKLARCINRGESVKQAITQTYAKAQTSGQSQGSNPQGRTAAALKAWYKAAKGDKRAAIVKAVELLGLRLKLA